jgi:hypothetical protein
MLYYTKKDARRVCSSPTRQERQASPETQEDLEDSKANEKGGEGPFSRTLGGAYK